MLIALLMHYCGKNAPASHPGFIPPPQSRSSFACITALPSVQQIYTCADMLIAWVCALMSDPAVLTDVFGVGLVQKIKQDL